MLQGLLGLLSALDLLSALTERRAHSRLGIECSARDTTTRGAE
jgi:hypothetical protein